MKSRFEPKNCLHGGEFLIEALLRRGLRLWAATLVLASLSFVEAGICQNTGDQSDVSVSPLPQNQGPSAMLQNYQQGQWALIQERQALLTKGATAEQLEAWRQQNAARIQIQQQKARWMAMASELQVRTTNLQPDIPENASPTLRDFLAAQAALVNADATIHNQLLQSLSSNPSEADIIQMMKQETEMFQQQHATEILLQQQRAKIIATEAKQG
jgi:hypothetical protein